MNQSNRVDYQEIDPLLRPDSPIMIDEEDVPKHYQIIAYQETPSIWTKCKFWIHQIGYDIYYRIKWIYTYGF